MPVKSYSDQNIYQAQFDQSNNVEIIYGFWNSGLIGSSETSIKLQKYLVRTQVVTPFELSAF